MVNQLTYHLRTSTIAGMVAGEQFALPVLWNQFRATTWLSLDKFGQHREDQNTIVDSIAAGQIAHKIKVTYNRELEIYDYPSTGNLKWPSLHGSPLVHHAHAGASAFIKDEYGGLYIHGWPPCNISRCIVVICRWESLLKALTKELKVRFNVQY